MKMYGVIIGIIMMAGVAMAQGTAAEAQQTSLLSLIKTGGWAMWPLGGFSVFMD